MELSRRYAESLDRSLRLQFSLRLSLNQFLRLTLQGTRTHPDGPGRRKPCLQIVPIISIHLKHLFRLQQTLIRR